MWDIIKTILHGSLGSLSFGIYHGYISRKQIEEHNRKRELRMKEFRQNILKITKNIPK